MIPDNKVMSADFDVATAKKTVSKKAADEELGISCLMQEDF